MNMCSTCGADIKACKETLDRYLSCEEINYLNYCKHCGGRLYIDRETEDDLKKCHTCSRPHTLEGDLITPRSATRRRLSQDYESYPGVLFPNDKGRDEPYKPPEN